MLRVFFPTILLLWVLSAPVFSQSDEKSSVIGDPSMPESAANIVADIAGNTYVGGVQANKGLIVKQNALHVTLWSKTLSFTTNPNDDVTIAFMDLVGDTVFGCGKIHQFNQAKGTFYFKMNAQTGVMYWTKFELTSNCYLSCMRYSNGKYFLVGGSYGSAQVTCGKVFAVSSQNGNMIWETPLLKYVMPVVSTSPTTRTFFLNATEVKNGKFYITGHGDGNSSALTNWLGMPLLIGITDAGSIFMERNLLVPYLPNTSQRFTGAQIRWDMDDNLVLFGYELTGNSPLLMNNTLVVKLDQAGNVLFANGYNIGYNVLATIDAMNETASSFVIFGYGGFPLYDGLYVCKIAKDGTVQTAKSIYKPNVYSVPMGLSWTHLIGNSAFINGQHYFTMEESADINQYILDEDLDFIDDCSELNPLDVITTPISVSIPQLALTNIPQTMNYQNGGVLDDVPVFAYCDHVSLDLVQNSGCGQSLLQANSAGFTSPTYYWSTGDTTSTNTLAVNTTDTIFLRVLDIKCCELIDTIVPTIVPSTFAMNLPADTTICLQPGNSFTIQPVVSGANAPVQYLWSTNSTTPTLSITQSGTYWLDASDTCLTLRDSIVVTVTSLPVIGNTANITVCEDDFPAALNPTVSAGASVLWDDSTTVTNRSVTNPGTYTISATNNCGTVNASITVSQTDLPDVQLVPLVDTCLVSGTGIVLNPITANAATILWSDGSSGNQLPVSTSGIYKVYVSNSCGIDSAASHVTIRNFPELDLPAVLDTCFEIGVGFSYTAQGSPGSYQWSSGSQTATEWISQEGVYSVTLTNSCGSITDSMQVRRLTEVDLYFPKDSLEVCTKLLAVSALQIETNYNLEVFAPNGDLAGLQLSESGLYTIHAFNACGEKWDSIYVNLQNEQFFYLPNSFTPNGDEHNARFEFQGDNITIREIRIFNRWGEEVFTESGNFTGWNGMYRGTICPDGMYAVHVIYEDCFGLPTEFKGHVNLIR